MGFVTARTTVTFELLNNDQYTFLGPVITYFPAALRLTTADRYNQQTQLLSAGLSAQLLDLTPLGVSAPAGLVFFLANNPVDMRFGDPAASAFVSAVMLMVLGAQASGVYVTTGSAATQYWLMAAGGSGSTLTVTTPNP